MKDSWNKHNQINLIKVNTNHQYLVKTETNKNLYYYESIHLEWIGNGPNWLQSIFCFFSLTEFNVMVGFDMWVFAIVSFFPDSIVLL